MTETNSSRGAGAGSMVLVVVAIGLWSEFHEAGDTAWNIALALMLVGLAVAAFIGQRYFRAHAGEIGEARFDTRNEGEK